MLGEIIMCSLYIIVSNMLKIVLCTYRHVLEQIHQLVLAFDFYLTPVVWTMSSTVETRVAALQQNLLDFP